MKYRIGQEGFRRRSAALPRSAANDLKRNDDAAGKDFGLLPRNSLASLSAIEATHPIELKGCLALRLLRLLLFVLMPPNC
jgi:hypothetical protein